MALSAHREKTLFAIRFFEYEKSYIFHIRKTYVKKVNAVALVFGNESLE